MAERTVSQSMAPRNLVSLGPAASVHEAACVMTRANVGSVLIMDPAAGTLLGILTERDLMTRVLARALDPTRTTTAQVMTRSPRCVEPHTPVSDAVALMLEHGFRHLPVVKASGRILGVFSVRDALPRELTTATSLVEFRDSVNDALG